MAFQQDQIVTVSLTTGIRTRISKPTPMTSQKLHISEGHNQLLATTQAHIESTPLISIKAEVEISVVLSLEIHLP